MSNPLKRYTGKFLCEAGDSILGSPHWEHPEGEWVKYEDYARLKKAGDAIYQSFDEFGQVDASTLKQWKEACHD
ncbi:hypothetical protein UFOVP510_4 [uncultured Caudovirales phage]|uniref:Uncharacterized protein n=1 Tax=uncultured Caudovirales phage TaxID=2100421 RepID=A0A6J5MPB2_9CAUD|nr:hypothetical protein UFOVP510_4 [uncultured Caudovirales phage]